MRPFSSSSATLRSSRLSDGHIHNLSAGLGKRIGAGIRAHRQSRGAHDFDVGDADEVPAVRALLDFLEENLGANARDNRNDRGEVTR
jgi:hypothetical protein